jgi:hypothetical protein
MILMVEPDSHEPASGLSPLYPARGTWPAVRFLFAKPAKEAVLEEIIHQLIQVFEFKIYDTLKL